MNNKTQVYANAHAKLEECYKAILEEAKNLNDEERKDFLCKNKEADLLLKALKQLTKSYHQEKAKEFIKYE